MAGFPRALSVLGLLVMLAACGPGPSREDVGGARAAAPAAPTAATAPSRPAPLERLRVGFANVGATHAPLWTAQEGGFFERQGLDVELVNLGPSQSTQAALLAGEAMVASVSGSSTLNVILAGGDLVIVGAVFDTMPYQLLTTPDITSLADLRGKIIGINRFGGAADSILRYLLRRAGVDPERETRILQVGAQTERVAALRSGAIQATLVDPPFQAIAAREGLRILLDTAELGLPYPQGVLVMNRAWLNAQRDTARRVLQSVVQGTRAFKTDRELGLRALQRWLQLDDQALLEETYTYFSRALPDEVLPRLEGLQLVIEEVAADKPEARNLRPEDLLDPTLARELS
ncbi:MAG TPA: ABC transporter substrate-binding protein [Chloroflexota bacterium]|nr:ABC transporter substrate-binding protein [Chloroflexota bacterium]